MSGGKGRYGLRYLQVDAPDIACEHFIGRETGGDDEDGEDWEEDDDA